MLFAHVGPTFKFGSENTHKCRNGVPNSRPVTFQAVYNFADIFHITHKRHCRTCIKRSEYIIDRKVKGKWWPRRKHICFLYEVTLVYVKDRIGNGALIYKHTLWRACTSRSIDNISGGIVSSFTVFKAAFCYLCLFIKQIFIFALLSYSFFSVIRPWRLYRDICAATKYYRQYFKESLCVPLSFNAYKITAFYPLRL